MTEKELSELYMRIALQFDSVLGTLVSKNLVFPDFVPGIRKDFYDSLNEEKSKDFERIFTYTQIIRRYIRENANNGSISLTQLAKEYSEESPGYVIQSWMRSRNTLEFLRQWEMAENPDFDDAACKELMQQARFSSLTITPSLWIRRTHAIGIRGNPKFCVTAKSGANRVKFIMGGRRVKRLPPCLQHNASGTGCQGGAIISPQPSI